MKSPTYKSLVISSPRLTLASPLLTSDSKRVLKICSRTQYCRTCTPIQIVSPTECYWNEVLRVSLAGGDTELPFEVFEEHEFGYHQREFDVWTGVIQLRGYNGEIKGMELLDAEGRRVGEVKAQFKSMADGEVVSTTNLVSSTIVTKTQAHHESSSITLSPMPMQSPKRQITSTSILPMQSYPNRVEIYSIVASLKNLDATPDPDTPSSASLTLNNQTRTTSVTRNRGLQPVWIQQVIFGATEADDQLLVRIMMGDKEVAVGSVPLAEVKDRKHVVSKQVEMFTSGTKRRCGTVWLDVRWRDKRELMTSPPKSTRRTRIYQSINVEDFHREPIKTRAEVHSHGPISQRSTDASPGHYLKRYAIGQNGSIVFPRAQRFDYWVNNRNPNPFYIDQYDRSPFKLKKVRGAEIGRGEKYDFTKETRSNPGVGSYQLPSIWERYKK